MGYIAGIRIFNDIFIPASLVFHNINIKWYDRLEGELRQDIIPKFREKIEKVNNDMHQDIITEFRKKIEIIYNDTPEGEQLQNIINEFDKEIKKLNKGIESKCEPIQHVGGFFLKTLVLEFSKSVQRINKELGAREKTRLWRIINYILNELCDFMSIEIRIIKKCNYKKAAYNYKCFDKFENRENIQKEHACYRSILKKLDGNNSFYKVGISQYGNNMIGPRIDRYFENRLFH